MTVLDDRASATGTVNFGLALIVGAIASWIIREVTSPVLERADTATAGDSVGATAVGYSEVFLGYQPVLFLFTAFFAYVALAVFQRQYAGY